MAGLAELLAAATDPHGYSHRLPRSRAAMNKLQPPLTPEEMNLYRHHLMNMKPGRWIKQPDGQTSTIIQMSEDAGDYGGTPGVPTNFPSVWNGRQLHGDKLREAIQPISQWPTYPNYDAAAARYEGQMHPAMELDMMPSKLLYPRR